MKTTSEITEGICLFLLWGLVWVMSFASAAGTDITICVSLLIGLVIYEHIRFSPNNK